MGGAAFRELLRRRDRYEIVLLLQGSRRERRRFAPYEQGEGVALVWGDLSDRSAVEEAVDGCDQVLHPAAFIAPAADHDPKRAYASNAAGTQNIVAAIKKQPGGAERIRLVNVCSVAAYGGRLPPHHLLRVGDPLRPSVGDFYATTKIAAERAVIESGIRHWASLRQTWIAIPNILSLMDPIMFHQPLDTHIEMITAADAGYGLVQCLDCPDDFFRKVYNMSGGPSCRMVYAGLLERTWGDLGLGDYRKSMARNWFGLRNFHCGWYADGDVLNDYLGHWRDSLDVYHQQVNSAFPAILQLGCKIAPSPIVKLVLRAMADPLKWVRGGREELVKAFFGSERAWREIGGWDDYEPALGAGEDEPGPEHEATDPHVLAELRGGECLSSDDPTGHEGLRWRCGAGHQWEASSAAVRAGHWCPDCMAPPWTWDDVAKVDPLLAKYHYASHDHDESQAVDYLYCPNE
jgi:nucleoside-diphosphate-sugar epimerase